jgi:hypothetical protein
MGENSGDLERFRYAWIDLHVVANFIWIGSLSIAVMLHHYSNFQQWFLRFLVIALLKLLSMRLIIKWLKIGRAAVNSCFFGLRT